MHRSLAWQVREKFYGARPFEFSVTLEEEPAGFSEVSVGEGTALLRGETYLRPLHYVVGRREDDAGGHGANDACTEMVRAGLVIHGRVGEGAALAPACFGLSREAKARRNDGSRTRAGNGARSDGERCRRERAAGEEDCQCVNHGARQPHVARR